MRLTARGSTLNLDLRGLVRARLRPAASDTQARSPSAPMASPSPNASRALSRSSPNSPSASTAGPAGD